MAKRKAARKLAKATTVKRRGKKTGITGTSPAMTNKKIAKQPKRVLRSFGELKGSPENGAPVGHREFRKPREIKLDKIVKRQDMGDVARLARSIDERGGLLHPVVIDRENQLIAGQRRLAAWPLSRFRHEPIPVSVFDIDNLLAGEWDENAHRKDFTPSEQVEIARRYEPELKQKARERERAGRPAPAEEKGEVVDLLGKFLGTSGKTLAKAREVVEAAEQHPKKFGPLKEAMDKSGKVNGPFKRLQVLRQVEDIKKRQADGALSLPEGIFDRFVTDVPWPYEIDDEAPAERGRAARKYATMSIRELMALPIAARCADNCVMWFATTNFHMEVAFKILRAWGFTEFPTILTWGKTDGFGKGQRLRNQTEHWIVAIKGKPVWNLTNETTLLLAPTTGMDSEKPPDFYALIDAVTPAERSLELFARRELPEGWVGFGDQVGTLKNEDVPGPEFETFGNISEGLLKVLGAIERGEPIDFNENDHVVRGLYTGKKKRKLTKAGRERLAELRARSDRQKAEREKEETHRERLRKAAERAGHEIVITFRGEDEARMQVATCSCGWECAALATDQGAAWQGTEISDHQRGACRSAPQLQAEAEVKTARRGSRRAKRPPAPPRPDPLPGGERECAEIAAPDPLDIPPELRRTADAETSA